MILIHNADSCFVYHALQWPIKQPSHALMHLSKRFGIFVTHCCIINMCFIWIRVPWPHCIACRALLSNFSTQEVQPRIILNTPKIMLELPRNNVTVDLIHVSARSMQWDDQWGEFRTVPVQLLNDRSLKDPQAEFSIVGYLPQLSLFWYGQVFEWNLYQGTGCSHAHIATRPCW